MKARRYNQHLANLGSRLAGTWPTPDARPSVTSSRAFRPLVAPASVTFLQSSTGATSIVAEIEAEWAARHANRNAGDLLDVPSFRRRAIPRPARLRP